MSFASSDSLSIPAALLEQLAQARKVVVFTGAGVSAESGISTFRSGNGGLWARFNPHDLATPDAFQADPAAVWGWYEWRRAHVLRARPNPAHHAIAAMQRHFADCAVVTQNVDNLHERSGSRDVVHLHGRLEQARCFACQHPFRHGDEVPELPEDGCEIEPPRCQRCDGYIRPGVVWFGENLPEREWLRATVLTDECDVLFCVGTSALVYPAAALPQRAMSRGATLVQVNPEPTPLDGIASFNLHGPAGEMLPALMAALRAGAGMAPDSQGSSAG